MSDDFSLLESSSYWSYNNQALTSCKWNEYSPGIYEMQHPSRMTLSLIKLAFFLNLQVVCETRMQSENISKN